MFGTYRFALALLVALSHFGWIWEGFNPGQWAVVGFYVLSGFLMERQFHKLAPRSGVRGFYLDRFLRIYPLYLTVLILGLFLTPPTHPLTIILNVFLLPQNYAYLTGSPSIIDTAWSLACEAHFYTLVPILVLLPTWILRMLITGSLVIFTAASFLRDPTFWTYIFLPGMLFTFLTGILINRRDWKDVRNLYGTIAILGVVFMLTKMSPLGLKSGTQINVCVGYLLAVPTISLLSKRSPQVSWDKFLGLFSYPLFLMHPLVKTYLKDYTHWQYTWSYMAISIAATGALIILVEKPFDRIRYMIRKSTPPADSEA